MAPSLKLRDVVWDLLSVKNILAGFYSIIVRNCLLGFFRNIGIKFNLFIVSVCVFCVLIYAWQGKYFESDNIALAAAVSAFITFGAPTIWEAIFEIIKRVFGFIVDVQHERKDRLLANKSVHLTQKTLSKILSKTNSIDIEEVCNQEVSFFLVKDSSGRLWRTLNVDMYAELRDFLITQDVFLTEKSFTPFGYEVRKTFRGLMHCEDGPAYFDYYREGNEMKFLKNEYYFLDNRYESRDAWEAEMKDFYFQN